MHRILKSKLNTFLHLLTCICLCAVLTSCTPKLIREITGTDTSTSTTATNIDMSKFISVWRTTAANETITLPLRAGFNYNFSVDWGDGSSSTVTAHNDPDITHSYITAGDYTVAISGSAEAWYFNNGVGNGVDKDKIIQVISFGNLGWKNLDSAFESCSNLVSFAGGNTSLVTNMSSMFHQNISLTSIDLSTFDTSNVTLMNSMFQQVSALTSLNLSNFNTSAVTNMNSMFYLATSLTSLDLSNFNTDLVTDMGTMFNGASNLLTLNVLNWDISLATSSLYVLTASNSGIAVTCNQPTGEFFGKPCALSFTTPEENSFVINATKTTFAITGTCSTAAGASTTITFGGDAAATSTICVSGVWRKILNVSSAGDGAIDITATQGTNTITRRLRKDTTEKFISTWVTSVNNETITLPLVGGYNYNFTIDWGDGSSDTVTASNDPDITHNFVLAGEYTIKISGLLETWNFIGNPDSSKLFRVDDLGNVGWIAFEDAFRDCGHLTSFAGGNTNNATNMKNMFNNASTLSSIDLSTFNTSNVTDMSNMFYGTSVLESLDLSNFNTTNVREMDHLFDFSANLTRLNVNGWDLTLSNTSQNVFDNISNAVTVYCDQGGTPGTGSFFGQACSSNVLSVSTPAAHSYVLDSTKVAYALTGTCLSGVGISSTITFSGDITTTTATCSAGIWSKSLNFSAASDGNVHIAITQDATTIYKTFIKDTSQNFISIWRTSAVNESITLPLPAGYNYSFTVDWGDSTANNVNSFNDPNITHVYLSPGYHTVKISGTVEAWDFNFNSTSATNLIHVADLGDIGWKNLSNAFSYCTNLLSFAGGRTGLVTDMSYMFFSATALKTLDVSSFHTSGVTNMASMFSQLTSLTALDITNFSTVSVTNMYSMFNVIPLITSLDLSNFNTANVINMSRMFWGVNSVTSLNLSNFNTTQVTDMSNMFTNMTSLTNLDISNFDTDGVTNMSGMFYVASSLTSLNLSHFNTSSVTNMSNMFNNMNSLASFNISSFNTAAVTNMSGMFYNCQGLLTLNLSNFNTALVTNMQGMFAGTSNLSSLNISSFNTAAVTDMGEMFMSMSSITTLNLSNFNTSSVINMVNMFIYSSSLTSLNLSNFNTLNVIAMDRMFKQTFSLTSLNTTNWNLGSVTSSSDIFLSANAGLTVTCNQGGSPGTGTFFGKTCN